MSHEEYDVGRTTTLSPDKPSQILPTVTLEQSSDVGDTTVVSNITGRVESLVKSPKSDGPQLHEKRISDRDIPPVAV